MVFKYRLENVTFTSIMIVYAILKEVGLTLWDTDARIDNYSNCQNSNEILHQSRRFDDTKPSLVKDEFVDSIQIQQFFQCF